MNNQKCCDRCKYYEWYYDRCTKWDCSCDAKECHSCFEGREINKEGQRMYIACEICKYNCEGNCNFYGNEIDMPCYKEKQLIKEVEDACWIKKDAKRECSRCGFIYSVTANFKYCPMCGIRIRMD